MAQLTSAQKNAVAAELHALFSGVPIAIPATKTQLRALLDIIDPQLQACETTIVSLIPAGTGKTWLLNNPTVGRYIIERVEDARRVNL